MSGKTLPLTTLFCVPILGYLCILIPFTYSHPRISMILCTLFGFFYVSAMTKLTKNGFFDVLSENEDFKKLLILTFVLLPAAGTIASAIGVFLYYITKAAFVGSKVAINIAYIVSYCWGIGYGSANIISLIMQFYMIYNQQTINKLEGYRMV